MDHILPDQGDVNQGEKRTEEKLKAESGKRLTTEITQSTEKRAEGSKQKVEINTFLRRADFVLFVSFVVNPQREVI